MGLWQFIPEQHLTEKSSEFQTSTSSLNEKLRSSEHSEKRPPNCKSQWSGWDWWVKGMAKNGWQFKRFVKSSFALSLIPIRVIFHPPQHSRLVHFIIFRILEQLRIFSSWSEKKMSKEIVKATIKKKVKSWWRENDPIFSWKLTFRQTMAQNVIEFNFAIVIILFVHSKQSLYQNWDIIPFLLLKNIGLVLQDGKLRKKNNNLI